MNSPRFSHILNFLGKTEETFCISIVPSAYILHLMRKDESEKMHNAIIVCRCGKVWPEGDKYELNGGKACCECIKAEKEAVNHTEYAWVEVEGYDSADSTLPAKYWTLQEVTYWI